VLVLIFHDIAAARQRDIGARARRRGRRRHADLRVVAEPPFATVRLQNVATGPTEAYASVHAQSNNLLFRNMYHTGTLGAKLHRSLEDGCLFVSTCEPEGHRGNIAESRYLEYCSSCKD
jgi:hypothetical protein